MVAVACGGDVEETSEAPETTSTTGNIVAPTTAPPLEKLVIWADEKIAIALDPLLVHMNLQLVLMLK